MKNTAIEIFSTPGTRLSRCAPWVELDANPLRPHAGQKLGITYVAHRNVPVEVRIYTVQGDFVHEFEGLSGTGSISRRVNWDGKDWMGNWVPVGMYLVEFKTGGFQMVRKVEVAK